MKKDLFFGAKHKTRKVYVLPSDAIKSHEYICPECKENVFLKNGIKNRAHFCHFKRGNCCHYSDGCISDAERGGGESNEHRYAKVIVKDLMEKNLLQISRFYNCCKKVKELKYNFNSGRIEMEKKIECGTPDISYWEGDECKWVIEIYHTHKTFEEDRKGLKWSELRADSIIDKYHDITDKNEIININDRRCIECSKCKKEWKERMKQMKIDKKERKKELKKSIGSKFSKTCFVIETEENKDKTYFDVKYNDKEQFKSLCNWEEVIYDWDDTQKYWYIYSLKLSVVCNIAEHFDIVNKKGGVIPKQSSTCYLCSGKLVFRNTKGNVQDCPKCTNPHPFITPIEPPKCYRDLDSWLTVH